MQKNLFSMNVTSTDSEKTPKSGRFHELWSKIEKHQMRNLKAQQKVDKLLETYQATVDPRVEETLDTYCDLLEHVLSFAESKKLNKKQKRQLFAYLNHQCNQMSNIPVDQEPARLNKILEDIGETEAKLFAKEYKKEVESEFNDIKAMFEAYTGIDLPDGIKEAMLEGDLKKAERIIQEAAIKHHQEKAKARDDEWEDFKYDYYAKEDDESSKVTEIFKAAQLTKMYKKIANVIHPDKEQDSTLKDHKNALMQKLVAAKDSGDVFTLIQMYQEHVPDGEYFLDANALEKIEHLLQMKVSALNREHKSIFNAHTFKSFVWQAYSDTSQKRIKAKMDDYIAHLGFTRLRVMAQIKDLATVERLIKCISIY